MDSDLSALVSSVASSVGTSSSLPSRSRADFEYYSTFDSFRDVVEAESASIVATINRLLTLCNVKKKWTASSVDAETLSEFLADVNDHVLERINDNLDLFEGIKKADAAPSLIEVTSESRMGSLISAKNVLRPQIHFSKFIDTSSKPFVHRLESKPHFKQTLEKSVGPHPYLFELDHFEPHNDHHISLIPRHESKSFADANFEFVDTEDKLEAMIESLLKENIIGVDVEAHWYRSFMGLSCLIQISTLDTDYVIDPFPLWEQLTALNKVLANPDIVKVMHGANSDVIWLQRDFSCYIVNLFDTHQAACVLQQPVGKRSLAALILQYFDVKLDKRYQLADWRLRPLPQEMLDYARSDVRLLIPLFVKMRDALLTSGNEDGNLVKAAWARSTDVCKLVFAKPELNRDSHLQLLQRSKLELDARQTFALQKIFAWRFETARVEDESVEYVLANHMLIKICKELPRELQGLVACCKPMPPLVKQHLLDLHKIVIDARDQSQEQLSKNAVKVEEESKLIKDNEGVFDLANTLDLSCPIKELPKPSSKVALKKKSSLIDVIRPRRVEGLNQKSKVMTAANFASPFERFCMLEPYLRYIKDESEPRDDDARTQSIKDHFDALTASTPKESNDSQKEESDDNDEEEEEVEDDSLMTSNVVDGDQTFVKSKNRKRKKKAPVNFVPKKAKLIDREAEEEKEEQQTQDGEKKASNRMEKLMQTWFERRQKEKEEKKSRQYNAWQQNSKGRKGKIGGGSVGAKRKAKNMNKSVSYKKK